MPGKIQYTNEQMQADLHEINRQMLHADFRPDVIIGVARGGLVPATMLSHYHGKALHILNYSLRDLKVTQAWQPHGQEMQALIQMIKDEKNLLIVDDICDSGDTLCKIATEIRESRDLMPSYNITYEGWQARVKTAVLWNNTAQDVFEADYVGREISRAEDERWVIFPYEEWWKA